jgi:phage gpG-like protein
MGAAGGGGVFISYRREGGGHAAGRLKDRLADRLGEGRVFMDVDAIEPGMDYVEAITRAVDMCAVLVAVIGPGWLTAGERGRRLDDPHDWVRVEIGTALKRGVRVIPVLVGGAVMPARGDLPEDLAGLAHRNALHIRHESFDADAGQLVAVAERVLTSATPVISGAEAARPADGVPDQATEEDDRQSDARRVARLLLEAERIANSITNESWKASALVRVSAAVAATDLSRAARLLGDAERITDSITDEVGRSWALRNVAAAATNPHRAQRLANSITSEYLKSEVLHGVVTAVAATDPDRAERIAHSVTEPAKSSALKGVAEAVAATDPDRAERIAHSITSEPAKSSALSGVAEAVAATDPERAERIAHSITNESWKASALSGVAVAVAPTDLYRAAWLLNDAERIAHSIPDEPAKSWALGRVAVAATGHDSAARLLNDAEQAANSTYEPAKSSALSGVAAAVAATDPDRAERIAHSITVEYLRSSALSGVAVVVAATDPDRAERIANSITSEYYKIQALIGIAGAVIDSRSPQ